MHGLRRPGSLDLSVYLRGVAVLIKTPIVILPLFLAQIVAYALGAISGAGAGGGGLAATGNDFLTSLIIQLVFGIGLGYALIGADLAWREQLATFSAIVSKGKRRLPDILWATIAFNFITYAAQYLLSFILPASGAGEIISQVVGAVVLFFIIYTMPGAANGGTPGLESLNSSVEFARAQPAPTIAVTVVYTVVTSIAPSYILPLAAASLFAAVPLFPGFTVAVVVFTILLDALLRAYAAVVLAKVYDDLTTRRFFYR